MSDDDGGGYDGGGCDSSYSCDDAPSSYDPGPSSSTCEPSYETGRSSPSPGNDDEPRYETGRSSPVCGDSVNLNVSDTNTVLMQSSENRTEINFHPDNGYTINDDDSLYRNHTFSSGIGRYSNRNITPTHVRHYHYNYERSTPSFNQRYHRTDERASSSGGCNTALCLLMTFIILFFTIIFLVLVITRESVYTTRK